MADDVGYATGEELALAIRRRHVSSAEIVAALLDRIERLNGPLNAVVTVNDNAMREAQAADEALSRGEIHGPLHGVPFTVKDALETAGIRTTCGYLPLSDNVPTQDATTVARLRAAGGIVLAKTNTQELTDGYQCDNPIFGRTNNPWNLDRTPGGSSGGDGAAIAAGFSPLSLGTDNGGSVRIPAHYCGICSLKPTEWRVPTTGNIPSPLGAPGGLRHFNVVGPMARSVADLRLALSLIAGPDGRQWEVPPVPLFPAAGKRLQQRRIAWTDQLGSAIVSGDTALALQRLASALAAVGCEVERSAPPVNADELIAVAWEFYTLESTVPPVTSEDQLGPTDTGNEMQRYMAALDGRDSAIAGIDAFFDAWDVLLSPVTVGTAILHCPPGTPVLVDGHEIDYWAAGVSFTVPFNLAGNPVVVLPLARSEEGLPIGVQVVGRRWQDLDVLEVAEQIAEVIGPFPHPPGY